MSIIQLPSSTVKLITSTQIITSLSSVVKELLENSLDAGATSLDVKLINNGLDRIEVKDNGSGISKVDTPHMALPNYTSKISTFGDLETVITYGFRGEALHAICQVGQVTVTTATSADPVSMTYTLDSSGNVTGSKPSHHSQGTTVTVTNIFKNLPVRRQFVGSGRRAQEELKQIEVAVKSLAVINPKCRVSLTHNKCLLWQKTVCSTLQSSFSQMIGYSTSQQLEFLSCRTLNQVTVDMLIPKRNCDIEVICKSTPGSSLVFINKRIVTYKKILKVLYKQLSSYYGDKFSPKKHAVCLMSVHVPPADLDVNLNPSKTQVLLKDEDIFLSEIEKRLANFYNTSSLINNPETTNHVPDVLNTNGVPSEGESSTKRRKLESHFMVSSKANEKLESKLSPCKIQNVQNSEKTHIKVHCYDEKAQKENKNHEDLLCEANSTDLGENYFPPNIEVESSQNLLNIGSYFDNDLCSPDPKHATDVSAFEEILLLEKGKNPPSENKETGNIESDARSFAPSFNQENSGTESRQVDSPILCSGGSNLSVSPIDGVVDTLETTIPSETAASIPLRAEETIQPLDSEAWSKGHLVGETGNFVQGACVLMPGNDLQSNDKLSTCEKNSAHLPKSICPSEPDSVSDNVSLVKPPTQMNSELRLHTSPKRMSPKRKLRKSPRQLEDLGDGPLDSSLLSVSSQMGRRELAAFTKFAREVRPQIILQNPGIAFTRVASMLAEQWRELSLDEKERYEEIARETAANRKIVRHYGKHYVHYVQAVEKNKRKEADTRSI